MHGKMKKERFIDIDKEIQLWVETFGQGENEACLFIAGAGANSSFWSDNLCQGLENEGFFVIRYDHRDIGYSSTTDFDSNPYDVQQLATDALLILDALGKDKAHVIGHSMGGFIAQLLAVHYPERVCSLVSASSSTSSAEVPLPPEKTWQVFMENHPQNSYEEDLPGFLRVWEYLNGTAPFDKELAIAYTENIYKRQDVIGALGENHVKAQAILTDRSGLLNQVKVPVLVIHGTEDYLVDKYGGIQTAACIPHAELQLIQEMGHLPFNPEVLFRFEHEIIRFINGIKKLSS